MSGYFAYGLNCTAFCCNHCWRRLSASTRFASIIACCSIVSTSGCVLGTTVEDSVGKCLTGAQSVWLSWFELWKFEKVDCEQVPGLLDAWFTCIAIGDSIWLWLIPARRWNSSSNCSESPPLWLDGITSWGQWQSLLVNSRQNKNVQNHTYALW
jgi:hypothetical protein